MSVYSDFSFQGDGPTPPPSPPGSTYPAMPYAVCQVDETPIVEQKRKTQKRPARLSQYHTTTASSPFVDVEEMPSPSDPTSPTSTDGTSHKTTKTPAQKMVSRQTEMPRIQTNTIPSVACSRIASRNVTFASARRAARSSLKNRSRFSCVATKTTRTCWRATRQCWRNHQKVSPSCQHESPPRDRQTTRRCSAR